MVSVGKILAAPLAKCAQIAHLEAGHGVPYGVGAVGDDTGIRFGIERERARRAADVVYIHLRQLDVSAESYVVGALYPVKIVVESVIIARPVGITAAGNREIVSYSQRIDDAYPPTVD